MSVLYQEFCFISRVLFYREMFLFYRRNCQNGFYTSLFFEKDNFTWFDNFWLFRFRTFCMGKRFYIWSQNDCISRNSKIVPFIKLTTKRISLIASFFQIIAAPPILGNPFESLKTTNWSLFIFLSFYSLKFHLIQSLTKRFSTGYFSGLFEPLACLKINTFKWLWKKFS